MMILAIDPGPTKSAWVIYNPESPEPIVNMNIDDNEFLLVKFFDCDFESYVDLVVIEMIASFGMPVGAEVFETCLWIGRFIQLFNRLPVHKVYRRDAKHHLCNSSKAKDANIRQALIDKVGPQGTKKKPGPTFGVHADLWSALAVAVTFWETKEARS
jgi:hypothetical protein